MAEKEGAKDIVSRRISIFSLVISTLSFFYGNIDERFYGSVSVSSTTAQVTGSEEKPGLLVQGIALTFINAGNRPIAIEHVSYAILGSEESQMRNVRTKTIQSIKNQRTTLYGRRAL
jgi:hypothetical protein